MNAHNSDITEGSLLHRALRITPGYAPVWFCSRNSCAGFDLLTAIATVVVGCMMFLPNRIGWWTWAICSPLRSYGWCLRFPFRIRSVGDGRGDAVVSVCGADKRIQYRGPRVRSAVELPNPAVPEIAREPGPVGGSAANKEGRSSPGFRAF